MSEFEEYLTDEEESHNERFWEIVDMYENCEINYDEAADMLYELNNRDADETAADLELLDMQIIEKQKGN